MFQDKAIKDSQRTTESWLFDYRRALFDPETHYRRGGFESPGQNSTIWTSGSANTDLIRPLIQDSTRRVLLFDDTKKFSLKKG